MKKLLLICLILSFNVFADSMDDESAGDDTAIILEDTDAGQSDQSEVIEDESLDSSSDSDY